MARARRFSPPSSARLELTLLSHAKGRGERSAGAATQAETSLLLTLATTGGHAWRSWLHFQPEKGCHCQPWPGRLEEVVNVSQRDCYDFIPSSFLFRLPLLQFAKQSLAHPTGHPAPHHGASSWRSSSRRLPGQFPQSSPFQQSTISSQCVPHPTRLAVTPLKKHCSNSAHKPAPPQTRARFPARDWLREGTLTVPGEKQGAAKHRFRSCSISRSKRSHPLCHN